MAVANAVLDGLEEDGFGRGSRTHSHSGWLSNATSTRLAGKLLELWGRLIARVAAGGGYCRW